jgi:hypothetical protein
VKKLHPERDAQKLEGGEESEETGEVQENDIK